MLSRSLKHQQRHLESQTVSQTRELDHQIAEDDTSFLPQDSLVAMYQLFPRGHCSSSAMLDHSIWQTQAQETRSRER